MEQEITRVLSAFADTYKVPAPFWTSLQFEEVEGRIEATVYVSIQMLPNPMFLTNVTFACMLQKLVSNPVAILEDGRPLHVYFAVEENGAAKQAAFRKYGDNPGEVPLEFYTDMYEQGMKKLGSFVDQMTTDMALAYWTVRGLGAVVSHALKAGEPQRKELPEGLVLHTSRRRR